MLLGALCGFDSSIPHETASQSLSSSNSIFARVHTYMSFQAVGDQQQVPECHAHATVTPIELHTPSTTPTPTHAALHAALWVLQCGFCRHLPETITSCLSRCTAVRDPISLAPHCGQTTAGTTTSTVHGQDCNRNNLTNRTPGPHCALPIKYHWGAQKLGKGTQHGATFSATPLITIIHPSKCPARP